jgi:hypothetical protein
MVGAALAVSARGAAEAPVRPLCGATNDDAKRYGSDLEASAGDAMKLPNAERAEAPPEKLRDYLLSPSHPVGRFKARFGEEAEVVTIWILSSSDAAPRFVTAYPLE